MKRLAVVLFVLVLAAPASARGPKIAFPNPVVARAIGAAYGYWGMSVFEATTHRAPCTSLRVRADVPDGGVKLAYSTYKPFGSRHCIIGISTHFRDPVFASQPYNWSNLCREVIHETGHLLDLPHSTDNTSIMWFDALAPTVPLPQVCH